MTAQILDGKALAATVKADLAERVAALKERGITPGLGTVLVGDDPGSHSYVREHRLRQGRHRLLQVELPAPTSADELLADRRVTPTGCTGYIVRCRCRQPGRVRHHAGGPS